MRIVPRMPRMPPQIENDPRKLKAVEMLAGGARLSMTWIEIAEALGVHRDTLLAWRKDPLFQEAVQIVTMETLRDVVPGIYKCLFNILKGNDNKAALRAAELLLRASGQLVDRVENTTMFNASPDAKSILANLDAEIEALERGK